MRFLWLLLFSLPVFADGLPKVKPEDVGLSSERLARIRPAIQRYLDREEIAGAVSLVARRGRVAHLETFGVLDLESKKPMQPETIFRIASMTRERKPEDAVGDVTKRLAKLPLNFQPGTAWAYGPATDVVGHLVEVISGQTLDRFFEERIFRPLAMTDTYFYPPEEKEPRFASSYAPAQPKGLRLLLPGRSRGAKRYFSGAGGLASTAQDYFRFCQMLLNGGQAGGTRFLSRKTVDLMTSNHIGNLPLWSSLAGYRFGLGFRVLTDLGESANLGSLGSYGWGGAFGTYFWIDPKEEMIGILMIQVRPYNHLNIRQEFQTLAMQAIAD